MKFGKDIGEGGYLFSKFVNHYYFHVIFVITILYKYLSLRGCTTVSRRGGATSPVDEYMAVQSS